MRGYYGYGPYSYGYGPYVGQQPALPPTPQAEPSWIEPYEGPGLAPTPRPRLPARTMSYADAHRYLVACVKNLDAAGVPNEEIITLLLWFGINEAASGAPGAPHAAWNRRKIEAAVAQIISMSAVRNQPR